MTEVALCLKRLDTPAPLPSGRSRNSLKGWLPSNFSFAYKRTDQTGRITYRNPRISFVNLQLASVYPSSRASPPLLRSTRNPAHLQLASAYLSSRASPPLLRSTRNPAHLHRCFGLPVIPRISSLHRPTHHPAHLHRCFGLPAIPRISTVHRPTYHPKLYTKERLSSTRIYLTFHTKNKR